MASWFSRFLRKRPSAEPAQRIRIRTARFRHLLDRYGRFIRTGEDADEKQSGDYILDKQYVVALSDQAFETVEGIVYDLNVLTSQQHVELYEVIEAFREQAKLLLGERTSAGSPAQEEGEEPEYRLLREIRKVLFQTNGDAAPQCGGVSNSIRYKVVEFAQEAAGDALVELVRSLGSSLFPLIAQNGSLLPIRMAVVDLLNHLAGANDLSRACDPLAITSAPWREFLSAFSIPEFWKDQPCGTEAPDLGSIVAIALEDSLNVTILRQEGFDLVDAHLSSAADSNHLYCRIASNVGAAGGCDRSILAGEIMTRLGFSVAKTAHGVTGWSGSQPVGDAAMRFRAIARMAAYLFQHSSSAIRLEDNISRFFEFHD